MRGIVGTGFALSLAEGYLIICTKRSVICLKGNPYGSHRVISPVGLLPQAAERVNNDPVICDNEILIAVEALQPTATAFGRIGRSAAAIWNR